MNNLPQSNSKPAFTSLPNHYIQFPHGKLMNASTVANGNRKLIVGWWTGRDIRVRKNIAKFIESNQGNQIFVQCGNYSMLAEVVLTDNNHLVIKIVLIIRVGAAVDVCDVFGLCIVNVESVFEVNMSFELQLDHPNEEQDLRRLYP